MGTFKAVGYPEDVGEFYKLDEYKGHLWTSHGRFPTNTPGLVRRAGIYTSLIAEKTPLKELNGDILEEITMLSLESHDRKTRLYGGES